MKKELSHISFLLKLKCSFDYCFPRALHMVLGRPDSEHWDW